MLACAMNAEDAAPYESFGLESWWRLEWLPMGAKPGFDDPVAKHTLMNAARNGFHLG
jgi:hypothetical protein